MGQSVWPGTLSAYPGLAWSVLRRPRAGKTLIQESVSGRETRVAVMAYPLFDYQLTYTVLRGGAAFTELQTLMGFFLARQGSFDSFLLDDPSDDTVTGQAIGTGDGATASFQLVRTFGGFVQPITNPNLATIYVAGTSQPGGNFNISVPGGVLTFTGGHIPTAGQAITADLTYYWRVRFKNDQDEFEQFMKNLWTWKKVELIGVKNP